MKEFIYAMHTMELVKSALKHSLWSTVRNIFRLYSGCLYLFFGLHFLRRECIGIELSICLMGLNKFDVPF